MLGTLTVLIYRLGVWRQEMQNTRDRSSDQHLVRASRADGALAVTFHTHLSHEDFIILALLLVLVIFGGSIAWT